MNQPLFILAAGAGAMELLTSGLVLGALALAQALLIGTLVNFLLSLPMRRRERARFILDLFEAALARGDSVERSVVSMAATQDKSPGVRFHLLAAYLEDGFPLDRALEKVPNLLPKGVVSILSAGIRLGDLKRLLPACKRILKEGASEVQSATNYAVVLLLAFSPLAVWITCCTYVFILPKFEAILKDLEAAPNPAMTFAIAHPAWIIGPQIAMFALMAVTALFYVGGQRMTGWTRIARWPWADWIAWRVPWKRRRMQRTFSVVLTALLDGGVPEAEAVKLAADGTANEIFKRRAAKVCDSLARGVPLSDAVALLDASGEFRWRLTNAIHGGSFLSALRGWHEALEAQAFREEQTAAHLATTGMVLFNGFLVCVVALATLGSLVSIIDAGTLW